MKGWGGNSQVFKGYAKGEGKQPTQGMSDDKLISFEDASKNHSFGGKLKEGFIDISFDSDDLSQKFWDMAQPILLTVYQFSKMQL